MSCVVTLISRLLLVPGKSCSCLGKFYGDCSSVCLVIWKGALPEIDIVGCLDFIRFAANVWVNRPFRHFLELKPSILSRMDFERYLCCSQVPRSACCGPLKSMWRKRGTTCQRPWVVAVAAVGTLEGRQLSISEGKESKNSPILISKLRFCVFFLFRSSVYQPLLLGF